MRVHRVLSFLFLAGVLAAAIGNAQEVAQGAIPNWPAPPFWSPPPSLRADQAASQGQKPSEEARPLDVKTATPPLPFIAVTPCRMADTRAGSGFTGQYGPPSITGGDTRPMVVTGQCGVASGAAAVSLNITVTNISQPGDLRVFPFGGSLMVSTQNWTGSTGTIANAAVVQMSGGAITIQIDGPGTVDVIVDVNGYYAGSVVTSLTAGTGLMGSATTGDVTLNLNFGGSGSAVTASRSDHTHGTADLVSGLLADARLGGTYSNALTFSNASNSFTGNFTGTFTGNGAGLTNVNASLLGGQPGSFYRTFTVPPPSNNSLTSLTPGSGTSSATIGTDGLGLITFGDTFAFGLRMAHCSNVACSMATISPLIVGATAPRDTSLVIGTDGLGLISFYAIMSQNLHVVHCSNLPCTSATSVSLEHTLNVGGFTSLAIGTDGLGLISYYAASPQFLKVAHCSNVPCSSATLTVLDSTANVGGYSSLAIGADGLGLISYYDSTNGDLKVAHCSNVTCTSATLSTLDSAGDVGQYTSVTVGADGLGLISYYDVTGRNLKIAHCSDVACSGAVLSTIDAGVFAFYTSVTVGADGLPLISYIDQGAQQLKVAHCSNALCAPYFRRR